ncbi:MAG: hypothetical protein NVS3B21_03520 [Acidimicrobiales bacterium]
MTGRLATRGDYVLVAVGLAIVQFLPTHLEGDGLARYQVVDAIAHGQSVAGARYPVWGVLGSLPLYAVGRALGHPRLLTAHYNGVLLALGVIGLGLGLRDVISARTLRFFLLLMVAGSMFPAHAEEFYGEVFSALLVGIGVVLVVRWPGRWVSWVPLVLGVANIPATAPALVALVGWRAVRDRRLRYGLAVVAAACLVLVDAAARHQSLLFGSYGHDHGELTVLPYSGRPGFSFPVVLGVAAILFTFGKGLIFFVPGLFVSLSRAVRARLTAAGVEVITGWVIVVAVLVVLYGAWWGWDGGFFWGPRFFLVACLPAALALAVLLAAPPHRRWAGAGLLGLLALSAYVAVDGATLQSRQTFLYCQAHAVALPDLCTDTPEFSPLWRPFLDVLHPTVAQGLFLGWGSLVAIRLAGPTLRSLRGCTSGVRLRAITGRWSW